MIKISPEIKMRDRREIYNLSLFSLGQFVSVFGTSVYTFAIGLYVLKVTGSGLSFATTLGFGLVAAVLFNPIAGVMADRLDKKKIVVITDLMNGLLFISVYLLSSIYGLNLIIIYSSTFLATVFTTIFGISFEAAKPNIVSDKKLISINTISRVVNSISTVAGPFVGGLIFAFIDIKIFILINGISFLFSGISEIFIDFKYNYKEREKREKNTNFINDIKEGFSYIVHRKHIIGVCSILVAMNFFIGFSVTVPLPFILNNVLELSTKEFGIIESAFPIGMILGAMFAKRAVEKISYNKLLAAMSFVLSICMVSIGIPLLLKNFWQLDINYLLYYSVIMIIFGIAISLIDIPIMYMLQKYISEEFRGRVLSLSLSAAKIIAPIALIISGYLLNRVPQWILPITGGILLLVINIITLKFNEVGAPSNYQK